MSTKKLVVIGGGAAGFFCAINAARLDPSLKVVLVEKTHKLLSKVRISGGGRCNLTHACFDIAEMSRCYPRGNNFVKKTFHQFFTNDTIRWFEERGVKTKTESDGRMFPVSDSSQSVIDCLLNEAALYGVEILMKTEVTGIEKDGNGFLLQCINSNTLRSTHICIACGGFPKREMFSWLTSLGHSFETPVPSLFTFNLPGHPITGLMGVSIKDVKIKIVDTKLEEKGPVLITHWGLSGPAILKLSAWGARELAARKWEFIIRINWLAGNDSNENNLKGQWNHYRDLYSAKKIFSTNVTELPRRLWEFLLLQSGINEDLRFADLPGKTENLLIKNLVDYTIAVKGKTTFKEEFVTAGGIKLSEVDPQTMMSKKIEGLFFAGELLDVDGITGGFNFQHAWTSSFIAAKSIANSL